MQRTALVCIAKNEDRYIAEWLKYHLALGFDKIFVYQNNWRCTDNSALSLKNVEWIEYDGEKKQLAAYNDFLNKHFNDFDWVAFFDVDEFLVIKDDELKHWLSLAYKFYGIAVNWKYFGNNNILVDDNSYGVLQRFTCRSEKCHQLIKTILHLSRFKCDKKYVNFYGDPHHTDISKINSNSQTVVATNLSTYVNGPFNKDYNDDNKFLAHFFCKTYNEFLNKYNRGRADNGLKCNLYDFEACNINEFKDTYLWDFYCKNCIGHMRTGSSSRIGLQNLIDSIDQNNMTMVEIGSYSGESAEIFAMSKKFKTIICIDPWKTDINGDEKNSYTSMNAVEKSFDDRVSQYDCIIKHKGTIDTFVQSDLFKKLNGKIDLVYIDGLHTYDGCKHDIEMCQKFIKPIFAYAGHDYTDKIAHVVGVKKAVDELLGKPNQTFCDNSWIIKSFSIK